MSPDRELVCADCGATFTFSEAEQERYTTRGFADPKRCPACRAARRARRQGTEGRPRPQGRPGGRGGGPGRRPPRPRRMSQIVCDDCGREAQVPFEPIPGRPVFCPDCYRKHRREQDAT